MSEFLEIQMDEMAFIAYADFKYKGKEFTVPFIIDTGAQSSIISAALLFQTEAEIKAQFTKDKLNPLKKGHHNWGVSGESSISYVHEFKNITLNGYNIGNRDISIGYGLHDDIALIGMDILKDFTLLLSYDEQYQNNILFGCIRDDYKGSNLIKSHVTYRDICRFNKVTAKNKEAVQSFKGRQLNVYKRLNSKAF